MGEMKEIEVPTLVRSFPNKGMEQVGTTRKECMKRTPLKMQLGLAKLVRLSPYPNNRETRRSGSANSIRTD